MHIFCTKIALLTHPCSSWVEIFCTVQSWCGEVVITVGAGCSCGLRLRLALVLCVQSEQCSKLCPPAPPTPRAPLPHPGGSVCNVQFPCFLINTPTNICCCVRQNIIEVKIFFRLVRWQSAGSGMSGIQSAILWQSSAEQCASCVCSLLCELIAGLAGLHAKSTLCPT